MRKEDTNFYLKPLPELRPKLCMSFEAFSGQFGRSSAAFNEELRATFSLTAPAHPKHTSHRHPTADPEIRLHRQATTPARDKTAEIL